MSGNYSISSHPKKDRLIAYAKGACDRTESILLEVHMMLCSECSESVKQQQAPLELEFSDVAIENFSGAKMPAAGLLSNILEKVDAQPTKSSCVDLGLPEILLNDLPDRKKWHWLSFWPSKGRVAHLISDINGPYDLYIGIIDGANKTPKHSHNHSEQTLPLVGEYLSKSQVFKRGDWSEMNPGDVHEPAAGIASRNCVCLIRSHRKGFHFLGVSRWRNTVLAIVNRFV